MSDSCGIFFVDLPGVYTLNKNLGDIHDNDQTGALARAESMKSGEPVVSGVVSGEDVEDGGEEVAADDSAVAGPNEDSDESEDDSPKRLSRATSHTMRSIVFLSSPAHGLDK